MKKQTALPVLASAASAVMAQGASAAATYDIQQQIDYNLLLAAGDSVSGAFDLSALIPTDGNYNIPLDIVEASIQVFGYSNPDPTTTTNYSAYQQTSGTGYTTYYTYYSRNIAYYSYSYSCGWAGWSTCTGYSSYYYYSQGTGTHYTEVDEYIQTATTTRLDNVPDELSVAVGVDSFNDVVTDTTNATTTGPVNYQYQTSYTYNNYNYYYYATYSQYTDRNLYFQQPVTVENYIYGDLEVDEILSQTTVNDLAADAALDYAIDAVRGQFALQSIILTATLRANPIINPGQSVSLPGTVALIGAGLAGLGFTGRRRRKRSGESKAVL